MCDVDEMSLLEIGNMLNECGESGSGYETYYKVPNVDFENGMCPLSTDKNVLQMCNALPSNRIIYVYIVSDVQATQEYKPSQYDRSFELKYKIIIFNSKSEIFGQVLLTFMI